MYEYHDFNLKEYMRQVGTHTLPMARFGQNQSERPVLQMPLDSIKSIMY